MDFIHRAEEILGTEIRVLSGREEAHYSALGVISGFHPANGIAGDLGGGSLELVDVNGERDRRGHHAAARRPAAAGPVEGLARSKPPEIAREQLARAKLLTGGRGQGLLLPSAAPGEILPGCT